MEFIFALGIFLFAFVGLAAGLMLTGRPPQGSCGGLACLGAGACEVCPHKTSRTGEEKDG